MKLNIQTAAALAFTAALSGCVTMEKKPAAFDDGHSLAYNIARAGGLETGIKDASAPRIPIPGCESSMFNTASAAVAYANPTAGLSNAQGLGAEFNCQRNRAELVYAQQHRRLDACFSSS
jgi:hypothetical protein